MCIIPVFYDGGWWFFLVVFIPRYSYGSFFISEGHSDLLEITVCLWLGSKMMIGFLLCLKAVVDLVLLAVDSNPLILFSHFLYNNLVYHIYPMIIY